MWEYVEAERRVLELPDSKTGRKTIPLSVQAIDVLDRIPRISGNPWVICGEKPGSHLVNLQKTWSRTRVRAGLENVPFHDLQHTFASIAASNGASLHVIGGLLGHSQAQTTKRYAHLVDGTLSKATEAVGKLIEQGTWAGIEGGVSLY
jgi:integrase